MSDVETPVTVRITVDGREVEAHPGELVIDAAERAGVYIPRFCYHPRMKPVGMCRMCLVEIDAGRGAALQPSCMIPVSPDMSVVTDSERTRKAQEGVLEFLLINHPLDCPVCDKGGECPLQDQTFAYGPGESRFVEEKRHYEKPIPISGLVQLDRERCILCDRCTRFAKDVAGDPLIHFQGRGSSTEVNTFPDEPFSSYFSGNTVQICPVGALTASSYRFRARPWDLEETSSTCRTCSVGCSITIQSSRNEVLRQNGVDNDAVNWGWLCDRGRFDMEAGRSEARLADPLVGGTTARWSDALGAAATAIRTTIEAHGPSAVAMIGGARLTNEAAYAWARLLKGVIGTDDVDCQLGDGLPAQLVLGLPRATIADACAPKGTVVLVGPDVKEELPVLYLRLRHAVVEDGATLLELGHGTSGMSRYATRTSHALPGGDLVERARLLAKDLDDSRPVTVVFGRTSMSEDPAVLAEVAAIFAAKGARFLPVLRRGNVFGALDAGLAPGLLPGRRLLDDAAAATKIWGSTPTSPGRDTSSILSAAAAGEVKVLLLVGADPVADGPDRALAEAALERATVISVDTFLTESGARADVVLPAAGPAEVDGTVTNLEGRVQRVRRKVTPPGTARPDWMIAVELADRLGAEFPQDPDALLAELGAVADGYADVAAALDAQPDGVLVAGSCPLPATPTARRAPSPTGSTFRLVLTDSLYDAATQTAQSPSLAPLAPGTVARISPTDAASLRIEDGTVVTLTSGRGSIEVPASIDGGVIAGSIAVAANQPDCQVNRLLDATWSATDVRVEVRR